MVDANPTASLKSPAKLAEKKPKAPVSLAAWLNHMAADAGHPQVKRFEELAEVLQAKTRSLAVLGQQQAPCA